ncbi:5'-3' exonuclease [Ornithinimicrobium tianjinense]|uniref:5'-3' exonuclease n=1 Tax=Ornithinimicrobium tianjinense TaxID=1195761 RepID=A0A917BKH6_9MICO|nr:5'-3' exonuclease H3TH domain-containing protein [Ornithinimicrobium tianjinense]GGF47436.1 5'-3' exonuclease [Ornithinimicrobium tianjinense]
MSPDHSSPRLLLLDTASLYFRAFFGVKDLRPAPDGTPTNATRGLLDMVATLVTRFEPSHLVACWDDDWRPAFRVAAIPTYKAHRLADPVINKEEVPAELEVQVPVLRRALESFGIAVLGSPGHEADDVIGTLTARHHGRMPVSVVTGDRDLFQLVDDEADVSVVYTARAGVRDAEVIRQADLQERYGVATGAQYADMATLRGDTSDGLPGVKGIGDKTAAQLITTYGSLAALRQALADGDPAIKGARRTNLVEAGAYLDVAPAVVKVAHDAPLPDVPITVPRELADPETLQQLVESYDLGSPVGRLMKALGLRPE